MFKRWFFTLFWLGLFLSYNWPVVGWIDDLSRQGDEILGLPLNYAWIIGWALLAFVVLLLMSVSICADLAQRVSAFEETLG